MADLESQVRLAYQITRQYFGKAIGIYAPLYLSNYCENECLYCGFNAGVKIQRKKLNSAEITAECETLKKLGIQNILLLTGESRSQTPPEYLLTAVQIAKKYFPSISLEVYPLDTEEYRELNKAGVDGITIYQETYDREIYKRVHRSGKKMDYEYRIKAPERIAEAGIRTINMGVLLGLADWRNDTRALFDHLNLMLQKYSGIEYGLSFPRIQTWTGCSFDFKPVNDQEMIDIITTARNLFPRIDINLSTRESPQFRDNVLALGVTRISAGSVTTVGGYNQKNSNDGQFSVNDNRTLDKIKEMIKEKGFDPVITSWR